MALQGKPVAISNSATTIYTCPSGTEAAVHGLIFANNTGGALTVDLAFYDQTTATTTTVATDLAVAANSYITWAKPINMNAGDYIQATSSAASGLVCLYSVYEGSAAPVATGFTGRGVWDSASTYAVNDIVTVVGTGTYLALQASTNQNPTSATAYWMFLEGISASALPSQAGQAGKYLTTDGTDASWAALDVAGGGTVTSISSDLTLTSSSARTQVIAPTIYGLSVILPNPSSLSEGDSFAIINKGGEPLVIKNHLNSTIGAVLPQKMYKMYLADVATTDWEAGVSDIGGAVVSLATLPSNRSFNANNVYASEFQKTGATSFTLAHGFYNGAYRTRHFKFTLVNGLLTQTYTGDTSVTYPAFDTSSLNRMKFIDTDIAVHGTYNSSAPYRARVLLMDSVGLTTGTDPILRHTYDFAAGDEGYNPTTAVVGTRKVFVFSGSYGGTNYNYQWAVIDYSSSLTSPSIGTGSFSSGGSEVPRLSDAEALETGKVLVFYNNRSGSATYEKRLVVATISGTSASFGTSVSVATGLDSDVVKLRVLSATKAIAVYIKPDGSSYAKIVSISGTTITLGSEFKIAPFNAGTSLSMIKQDEDNIFCFAQYSTDGFRTYGFKVVLSGTTVVSVGSPSKMSDINGFSNGPSYSSGIYDSTSGLTLFGVPASTSLFIGNAVGATI